MKTSVSAEKTTKNMSVINYRLIIFFFVFIGLYIYLASENDRKFMYDSQYYWVTGDSVFETGRFNLLSFPETFRGYFLPVCYSFIKWIFGIINKTDGPFIAFWITQALLLATLIVYIIPNIFSSFQSIKAFSVGTIVNMALVLLFIKDIRYPLSDIPSFYFYALGLLLAQKSIQANSNKKRFMLCFLTGVSLYLAYNTRILYLYSIFLLIVWYIISIHKIDQLKISYKIGALLFIALGTFVVSLPQITINKQYTEMLTPRVLYEQLENYEKSGESSQLLEGFIRVKYDTYVGGLTEYPSPGLGYRDVPGYYLNQRVDGDFSIKKMVMMFIKYPFDVMGIYGRHLLVLMTPVAETYSYRFFVNVSFKFFLCICLWMIAGVAAVSSWNGNIKKALDNWYMISLIVPALIEIADAPEIRFFYPVYFCLFGVLCYKIQWKKVIGFVGKYLLHVVTIFVFVTLIWSGMYGDILMQNEYGRLQYIGDDPASYSIVETVYNNDYIELPSSNSQIGIYLMDEINVDSDVIYEISFKSKDLEKNDVFYVEISGTDYNNVMQDLEFNYDKKSDRYIGICASTLSTKDSKFRIVYKSEKALKLSDLSFSIVKDSVIRSK